MFEKKSKRVIIRTLPQARHQNGLSTLFRLANEFEFKGNVITINARLMECIPDIHHVGIGNKDLSFPDVEDQ